MVEAAGGIHAMVVAEGYVDENVLHGRPGGGADEQRAGDWRKGSAEPSHAAA